MWSFVHRIATDYFSICCNCKSQRQVHFGSKEDEPAPTGKMIRHSTSTPLLKALGRIESPSLILLKKNYESQFVPVMAILSCKVSFSTRDDRVVYVSAFGAEVWGSNFGSVKADTAMPTAHHRCAIYSKEAVLHGLVDGPTNSLHA